MEIEKDHWAFSEYLHVVVIYLETDGNLSVCSAALTV